MNKRPPSFPQMKCMCNNTTAISVEFWLLMPCYPVPAVWENLLPPTLCVRLFLLYFFTDSASSFSAENLFWPLTSATPPHWWHTGIDNIIFVCAYPLKDLPGLSTGSENRDVLPANKGSRQRHSVHHQQGDPGAGQRGGSPDQPQERPAQDCSGRWRRRQPEQPCTGTANFSFGQRAQVKVTCFLGGIGLKFWFRIWIYWIFRLLGFRGVFWGGVGV